MSQRKRLRSKPFTLLICSFSLTLRSEYIFLIPGPRAHTSEGVLLLFRNQVLLGTQNLLFIPELGTLG